MNTLRSPSKLAKAKRVIHFCTGSCQLGITAVLPEITVPLGIPGYDGLLPLTALGADLEVNIDWWDGALNQMRIQAAWKAFDPNSPGDPEDADLVGTPYVIDTSTDGPGTTFSVFVPQNLLTHGVYLLRIRAMSFPGGVIDWSDSIRVEVDTVAPGGNALPLLLFTPQVVTSNTVTDDDISNGKLWALLPHYEGIAKGDTLTPYLNNIRLDADSVELGDINTTPDFIPIGFNEQALLARGNGEAFFSYEARDKAGNFDGSIVTPLDIQLRTFPTNLDPPLVPQATDGLIDDADARASVRVNIPTFTNPRDKDEIVVKWGNQSVGGTFLTPPDLVNDPIIGIDLFYSTIFDAGNGLIDVLYEVWRGGRQVGISPATPVPVDLSLPGGPDPEPETPEHKNLKPALVRGDSGQDNVISPGDYVLPAKAFIPWLAENGADYFAVDDVIVFTWGSQTTSTLTRTIVPADVTAKLDLELTVPATTIAAEGSGDIPVFYTVTRLTSTPPHTNTSLSPSQIVKVTGANTLPGGGTVDAPSFPVLNVNQAIGQNELIGAAGSRYNPVLTRTAYLNIAPGDTVELFFVGYDDLFAGNLVPGAAYNPQPPHPLTAEEISADAYEFRVPATYHIAVCSQGAVEARVVFRNAAGPTNSNPTRVFCDVKNPGSPDCSTVAP